MKQEQKAALVLAIILFVVGIVCYSAFSAPAPEEPVRIMFKGTAGKVLFTHKTHASETGYGLTCVDCHHTFEEDGGALPCAECHEPDLEDEDIPKQSDAFHQQCIGCHEDYEAGPMQCASCHVMQS